MAVITWRPLSAEMAAQLATPKGGRRRPQFKARYGTTLVELDGELDAIGARHCVRIARKETHPDNGGRSEDFALVQDAAALLATHHKVSSL